MGIDCALLYTVHIFQLLMRIENLCEIYGESGVCACGFIQCVYVRVYVRHQPCMQARMYTPAQEANTDTHEMYLLQMHTDAQHAHSI